MVKTPGLGAPEGKYHGVSGGRAALGTNRGQVHVVDARFNCCTIDGSGEVLIVGKGVRDLDALACGDVGEGALGLGAASDRHERERAPCGNQITGRHAT